ncbi:MAG: hypothetical protein K2H11_01280, partial [Malacoplasma sp.]|nr:hypothetical protein [Malacoplasma sp.]
IYLLRSIKLHQFNKAIKEIQIKVEKSRLNNENSEKIKDLNKEIKLLNRQKEDFINIVNSTKLILK